jgi:hypothetical protein
MKPGTSREVEARGSAREQVFEAKSELALLRRAEQQRF